MVEGIMFSSANTGGTDGAQLDFNAVDTTRVQTVGSGAEIQRRGIVLDSVLKSGGNEFHGDVTFYGSADALEGSNLTAEYQAVGIREVAKLHELWDVSATLGGRIIPNKLWFFAAIHKTGFNREILDAFNPDGTPMLNKRRVPIWSGKLSYQMNQSNKFSGFYHTTQRRRAPAGEPVRSNRITRSVRRAGRAIRGQLADGARKFGRRLAADRGIFPEVAVFRRAFLFQPPDMATPILPRCTRSGRSIPSRK